MMKPSMKLMRYLFLGILSLAALTVWAESDVALVTDVTGGVLVDNGQKPWTPEPGETLQTGVAIELKAGGVLSLVHLKTQAEFVLKGPQKFALATDGVKGGKYESKALQAQLPQNLDLIARNLADGGGKNVSNLQSSMGSNAAEPDSQGATNQPSTESALRAAPAGIAAPAPQLPAPVIAEPKKETNADKEADEIQAIQPTESGFVSRPEGREAGKTNAQNGVEAVSLGKLAGTSEKKSDKSVTLNPRKFLIALPENLTSNKPTLVEESGIASWVYYVVPANSDEKDAVLETDLEGLKSGYTAKYNLNIPLTPGVKEALICESAEQAEQATAIWIELYKSKKVTLTILTAHLNRLREKILKKAGTN